MKAVFLPAAVRNPVLPVIFIPSPAAGITGAVGKEEVINNELVKMPADKAAYLPEFRQHLFIVVAEGVKQALLRFIPFRGSDRGGQAAGHLHPVLLKNLPAQVHMLLIRQDSGAVGLQVNLVRPQVLFKKANILFQLFLFRPCRCLRDKIIDQFKVPVVAHVYIPPSY